MSVPSMMFFLADKRQASGRYGNHVCRLRKKNIATKILGVLLLSPFFDVIQRNVDDLHEIDSETWELLNILRSLHLKAACIGWCMGTKST